MSKEIMNPVQIIEHHFEQAAARLHLDSTMRDYLRAISRELSFTLILENGKLYHGYLVQHDCTLGLYKGGTRFFPEVNLDEFRGLGKGMTWKNSFHGLPLGGMKGGVDCDPKTLTRKELKEICEKFIDETFHLIGPEMAVLGPDAGVTAEMMGWMMKRYSLLSGVPNIWGAVTGKPTELHGSYGRKDATGTGGAVVILEVLKKLGINVKDCRIIAEGFGNVNIPAVKILYKNGAKIIGLSDSHGAIFQENGFEGIDIERAIELKESGKKPLAELETGKVITHDELFAMPCDVWISAAVGTTITAQRAKSMNAQVLAELGNICATVEADEIFRGKKIVVLPDTMASGGGVNVSWYEMVQNRQWEQWPEKVVLAKLQKHMKEIFEYGWQYSQEKGLYLRDAVFDLAVKRVVDARRCTVC
ncbi:MAG: Glu/Leu/Phe/Val dehydrogenase [Candidatus Nealsonbacteria bacterium]|nr:Glu/Leu/Phe/Val dehydrogenase [Candidatus Nealsonbacteria bacterium]